MDALGSRQYRIVHNGYKFRVESRRRGGFRWWSWWEKWVVLSQLVAVGVWKANEYTTREEAQQALDESRRRDIERAAEWKELSGAWDGSK